MRDALSIAKALADDSRLRVLCALRGRELCVCQIVEMLQLAPSTVSKHLSLLYQARLVEGRKDGRWMHYRLPKEREAAPAVRTALDWAHRALRSDETILGDERRLRAILAMSPEELCQKQAQKSACCSSAPATRAAARWPKAGRGRSRTE